MARDGLTSRISKFSGGGGLIDEFLEGLLEEISPKSKQKEDLAASNKTLSPKEAKAEAFAARHFAAMSKKNAFTMPEQSIQNLLSKLP